MLDFNPFKKKFEDISSADLKILFEVSEGWYVEYKREVPQKQPKLKNIAKSISSFANQYGGWLFYGVEEKKDESRFAGSFIGIDLNSIHIDEIRVRNAVAHHLNPEPYYRIKILEGPCEEIGLEASKGIIMIHIPLGSNPHYIHSSGVIYRRIGDSSEPKVESDRFVLDQLWKRGEKNKERLKSIILDIPKHSQEENLISFLHLYFIRNLYGDKNYESEKILTFQKFSQIMKKLDGNFCDINFDNIYTSSDGYIARQIQKNNPYFKLLTFKYNSNITKIIIPINSSQISDSYNEIGDSLNGYKQRDPFLKRLSEIKLKNGTIIDINQLFFVTWSVLIKYKTILDEECFKDVFYVKCYMENVWRRIPFLDSKSYIQFIEDFNVPIVQDQNLVIPKKFDYNDYVKFENFEITDLNNFKKNHPAEKRDFWVATVILSHILLALGVPVETTQESTAEILLRAFVERDPNDRISNLLTFIKRD